MLTDAREIMLETVRSENQRDVVKNILRRKVRVVMSPLPLFKVAQKRPLWREPLMTYRKALKRYAFDRGSK